MLLQSLGLYLRFCFEKALKIAENRWFWYSNSPYSNIMARQRGKDPGWWGISDWKKQLENRRFKTSLVNLMKL